jgi:hypothetical protein
MTVNLYYISLAQVTDLACVESNRSNGQSQVLL